MRCEEIRDRLGEWLTEAVPSKEADMIMAHVAECDECTHTVDELRGLQSRLERLPRRLNGIPRDRRSVRPSGWLWPVAAAGIVVALSAAIGFWPDRSETVPAASGGQEETSKPEEGAKVPDPRALVEQLGEEDPNVREAAQKALVKLGTPAVPELTRAASSENAEVRLRARAALKQIQVHEDLRGAIEGATRKMEEDPTRPTLRAERARLRLRFGELRGALEDLDAALQLDPGQAQAWALRGHLRQQQGDLQGALQDLSEAIRLRPDSTEAHRLRAETHMAAGNHEAALESVERAIALDPADVPSHLSRVSVRLAMARRAIQKGEDPTENFTLAVHCCDMAVEIDPSRAEVWHRRGVAYKEWGEHLESQEKNGVEKMRAACEDFANAINLDETMELKLAGELKLLKAKLDAQPRK